MMEVWKPISYNINYAISTRGRVKRLTYANGGQYKPHDLRKVNKVDNVGYRSIGLFHNGKRTYKRIHRLVAEHFIPNTGNKRYVNHIDGDKLNNNVGNLEWCTQTENNQHAYRTGLMKKKMSPAKVRQLRHMYSKGNIMQKELAQIFGVHVSTIQRTLGGKSWSHI